MSAPLAPASARHRLHGLLRDFDRVLADEYEALKRRDVERLDTTTAAKQRLITEIEAASRGVQPPPSSEAAVQDEWEQIKRLLGRCALANRTNGAAIDASRSFVTSLLDVLCGRTASERVYQANGRLGGAQHGRSRERV